MLRRRRRRNGTPRAHTAGSTTHESFMIFLPILPAKQRDSPSLFPPSLSLRSTPWSLLCKKFSSSDGGASFLSSLSPISSPHGRAPRSMLKGMKKGDILTWRRKRRVHYCSCTLLPLSLLLLCVPVLTPCVCSFVLYMCTAKPRPFVRRSARERKVRRK